MTQLTYDFARTLAKNWGPGDEVVVTRLDHDANVRPWVQAATAVGATVHWATFDPATGVLDRRRRRAGPVPAHPAGGADGGVEPARQPPGRRDDRGDRTRRSARWCTSTACTTPRTRSWTSPALGADFYACSPYKFLGPHLGHAGGGTRPARGAAPGQAAARVGRGAGAVRVRHAAVRVAGRHHRRDRLPGRPRARRRVAAGAAGRVVRSCWNSTSRCCCPSWTTGWRGCPAWSALRRPGPAPHADHAVHGGGRRAGGGVPRRWPNAA